MASKEESVSSQTESDYDDQEDFEEQNEEEFQSDHSQSSLSN
jgi:hypothetical protein